MTTGSRVVRAWFASFPIAEAVEATRVTVLMERRFAGLRITNEPERERGATRKPRSVQQHRPGRTSKPLGATMQIERTQIYRAKTVAAALDVSVATIYRAVESGALRAQRLGTGRGAVRISGDAVLDYISACERAAPRTGRSDQPTTVGGGVR